jgi:diguanylate cyclase (GGDEF)-like protein
MTEANRYAPTTGKAATRRAGPASGPALTVDVTSREATLDRLLADAAADRELAAADRLRAAEYLLDSYRDELTGALQRRSGCEQLRAETDRAHRTGSGLAVMFVDVDGLKSLNDTIGHAAGDRLLAAVGAALRCSLRSYDIVVRYGGDEFVCALPGGTAAIVQQSSTRALRALAQQMPGATFSTGQSQLQPGEALESAIQRADADLYQRRSSASATRSREGFGRLRGVVNRVRCLRRAGP